MRSTACPDISGNNEAYRFKFGTNLWPGHRPDSPGPKTSRHHPGYVGQKSSLRPPPLLTFFLEEKRKLKPVDWVKKQVATFGLKQEDLGFATP